MAKLGEVCLINPKSCTLRDDTEVSFIPMTKVGEHGEFDASEIKNYSEVKKGFTNFQNGDILFAKITPCMENGKGAIAHNMKNGIGFGSTEFHVLRPDTDKITSEWLYYLTTWKTFRKEAEKNMTGSAGQKRVPKTFLENYVVNLPDIDTQKSENKILRKVDDLIFLRKQQLVKLDELVKARFVEMFGDVLLNSMQWPEKTLENMADIVSGITKGRKTAEADLQEVPYMAVSNVKDGYIDWTTVKTILATRQEIEQYRLMPDDILMTEGGDPDKVGRGAIIKVPLKNSIHQNHIFRVRLDEQEILPSFFAEYLRHQKAKRYFLGCAKQTTGIASINMRQLRALPTLVPPLSLQKQFAAFVERVDQQKQTVQQGLEKLELMKKALMQEYFG
ncbi:restriction endonuclease subunit S [Faecalibacterium taiwanense]|uniref:restriction endonuclease subunit S n=1 Tax=Faecalibacterium taiwanense TaxID=3030638 RepID=UPI002FC98644